MTFRLMQNNQTLKFNLSGLTNGLGMARGTTDFLQKERQRLEQINQALRQELCLTAGTELVGPPLEAAGPAQVPTPVNHELFQANPAVQYFPGGSAGYELMVIEEPGEAVLARHGSGEDDLPAQWLERGLLVLESITNSENGDLPLAILEQVGQEIGQADLTGNALKEQVEQALKALDHFLSARSMTTVMEARLVALNLEGQQLEEKVEGLREQDWAWHEWSNATRSYLAQLELENKRLKEPEPEAVVQPDSSKFSIVKWVKDKLLQLNQPKASGLVRK